MGKEEALYRGKRHYDSNGKPLGGIKVVVDDSYMVEVEGGEYKICSDAYNSKEILNFKNKNNKEILDYIHNEFSCKFEQSKAESGDFILCRLVVNDDSKKNYKGTVRQILDKMQGEHSCRVSFGKKSMKKGGEISPAEIEERWKKKKEHIEKLSEKIRSLRNNLTRDIKGDDEKERLTALALSVIDKTAERVGNGDSESNGHFGVTGFQKKHIKVEGNTVYLNYVGKSGVKHEKQFSDELIAGALKEAIKNTNCSFVFCTKDGFRIKPDKINRYLSEYGITAKDIRGYSANRWIVDKLNKIEEKDIPETEAKRKRKFNKILKSVAAKVGHGSGTLKKHYMIPELETEFVGSGKIIDLSNFYSKGGAVSLSKTPAPKSDRVYGSKTNAPKSAESAKSAKEIVLSESVLASIAKKIKEHNSKHPDKKISLSVAKAVVRRGMGAYSSTHRPTISGGKPNSRVAWGLARLNAFVYKAEHGKSKSGKYKQDDDLLDELNIKHKKYDEGGVLKRQVVGCIIYSPEQGFLILQRADNLEKNGGKWHILSGGVDSGEDLTDAALREIKEEIGYGGNIDLEHLDTYDFGDYDFSYYLAIPDKEIITELNNENKDFEWVKSIDEMLSFELIPELKEYLVSFNEGFKGEYSGGGEIDKVKLIKVKSFKTDEGEFDVYDIEKDVRGRADMFTVYKSKDGWIIRNALVPNEFQKKGIATDFYIKMNEESVKKTGKPLRSTQKRKLYSGEIVHELSKDGIMLWDSLVKKGYAIKLGEKDYRFNTSKYLVGGSLNHEYSPNCFKKTYSYKSAKLSIDYCIGQYFKIDYIDVDKEDRRKGYATVLIDSAKKMAKENGFTQIILSLPVDGETSSKSYSKEDYDTAVSFYKKNGFKFREGSSVYMFFDISKYENCIDFIKKTEAILNNGYYHRFGSHCLITYNSSNQKDLNVYQTVNLLLSKSLSELLKIDEESARNLISNYYENARRFDTLDIINELKGCYIIIADRDKIVCTNNVQFNKGGEILLAPNGKPSNLTPEQWHLVRTPAFKAWFGDWENEPENASKVIDENGEPLVVYHGTLKGGFNIFNMGKFTEDEWENIWSASHRSGSDPTAFLGSHFSKEKNIAEKFLSNIYSHQGDKPKIYECFLNIRNIKKIDENKLQEELISQNLYEHWAMDREFENSESFYEIDSEELQKKYEKNKEIRKKVNENVLGQDHSDALSFANYMADEYKEKNKNIDGIQYKNKIEGGVSYIAFNPNQIKLADGSNTTFDSNNPDIRFAGGGEMAQEYYVRTYADGTEQKISINDYEKNVFPNLGKGGSTLLAPNGKPSNLTPEQYKLVRTPEFIAWFGDWENSPETASKVVDENGEPLVVYHGTSSTFNIFKEEEKGRRGGLNEKFWSFSTNIQQAAIYAFDNRVYGRFSEPRIIPVFLNIKDMPVYDNEGKFYRELQVWGGYKWIDIFQLQDWHNRGFDMGVEFKKLDGFCVKNTIEMENLNLNLNPKDLIGDTYYVRHSNQIKLADGTNTTFDGSNPDIRYGLGGGVKTENDDFRKAMLSLWNDFTSGSISNYLAIENENYVLNDQDGLMVIFRNKDLGDFTKVEIEYIANWFSTYLDVNKKPFISKYIDTFYVEANRIIIKLKPEIMYAKGGEILLAPNGKPSNLTPEQYKLVRTPEFKAWFGDWENSPENASKVVDENGEPLVVYHGSKSESIITEFKTQPRGDGYWRLGKHFKSYADTGETEFVYFSSESSNALKYGKKIYPCFLKFITPFIIDNKGANYYGAMQEIEKAIQQRIDRNLNDSIVILNIQDSPSKYGDGSYGNTYMAKPTQIKLADGTNTTFDGSNPDIRYAKGGNVEKEKKSIYQKWKKLVNMTAAELEKFYNSEEGKEAGLKPSEAKDLGIHYGRESARWIIKMKKTPVAEWTPTMWEWAARQIRFNSRMIGNKGSLYDDNGKKTRKHTSLLIWGHNPEKKEDGGSIYSVEEMIVALNQSPFLKVSKMPDGRISFSESNGFNSFKTKKIDSEKLQEIFLLYIF